jgi:hypothetical protein
MIAGFQWEIEEVVHRRGPSLEFRLPINPHASAASGRDFKAINAAPSGRAARPPGGKIVRRNAAGHIRTLPAPIEKDHPIAVIAHRDGLPGQSIVVEIFSAPMIGRDCGDAGMLFPFQTDRGSAPAILIYQHDAENSR